MGNELQTLMAYRTMRAVEKQAEASGATPSRKRGRLLRWIDKMLGT